MSIALRGPRPLRALATMIAAIAIAPAAASAAPIPVTGTSTAVAPDAGLVSALTSLGASVKLTGAASSDSAGRFVFPVTGGALTPELAGTVNHTGGLEFRAKSGIKFGIRSFTIDTRKGAQLTAIPTLGGYSLGIRVPVATIENVAVAPGAGGATLVSGTLKLTDIGALYINLFLGTSAVKRGTVFGAAEATVTLAAS
ncbi:MAG: hypothetical protein JHD16_05585 [Solirubrobacteraceae bacterium]|nr:hypothetical protein [Solirubrobacteraceae bacterium]